MTDRPGWAACHGRPAVPSSSAAAGETRPVAEDLDPDARGVAPLR